MFEYATAEPLNFLKITPSYDTPDNKKFCKNWLECLDPKEFNSNNTMNNRSQEVSDSEESSMKMNP
jgi:hypothetical protein